MAGERELAPRREDADAPRVPRIVGRQHEHGLRQVELAGDRRHDGRIDAPRIGEDGELVAGEPARGEHVHGHESSTHENLQSWVAPVFDLCRAARPFIVPHPAPNRS